MPEFVYRLNPFTLSEILPFALSLSKGRSVVPAQAGTPTDPTLLTPRRHSAHPNRHSRESGKVSSHLKCNTWSWKTSAGVR